MVEQKITIAIDGHSSCGKSTVAKLFAEELKYNYIDSGAMYRAVTLFALQAGYIADGKVNTTLLEQDIKAEKIDILFKINPTNGNSDTYLNNVKVENEIRNIEVASNVSQVATLKFVREELVNRQRKMGINGGIIMDGRDIGTVVFPNAQLKIFLTANAETRAKRRYEELLLKGESVSFNEILININERDRIDSTRKIAPLKQANDAFLLDNSNLSVEETLQSCINLYHKILK